MRTQISVVNTDINKPAEWLPPELLKKASAYTPGPWKVRGGVNEYFIDSPPVICLAVVNSLMDTPKAVREAKANACLIAAAPELLEACKALVTFGHRFAKASHVNFSLAIDAARVAIAKS